MKKGIFNIFIAIALLGLSTARADFTAGLQAYQKGDFEAAHKILLPEAQGGGPNAQFALGLLYQGGKGVEKDHVQAYMWYTLAEEKGHKLAPKNKMEIAGEMTPEEIQRALELVAEFKESLASRTQVLVEKTLPTPPATPITKKVGGLQLLDEKMLKISGEKGGTISLESGAKLDLPKGAVEGASSIYLRSAGVPQIDGRDGLVGDLYSVHSLSRPSVKGRFTLELPYRRDTLPGGAIEDELTAVVLVDEQVLVPVAGHVDKARQVVVVECPEVSVAKKGPVVLKRTGPNVSPYPPLSQLKPHSIWYTIAKNHEEKEKLKKNYYEHKDHYFRLIFKVKTPPDFAKFVSKALMDAVKSHNKAYKSKDGSKPFAFLSPTNRMSVYIGKYSNDGRYEFLSWTGYIEIDLAKGNKDRPDLRNTLFHEMFHAVQDHYANMFVGGIAAMWWYEATADWAGSKGAGVPFDKMVKAHIGAYPELLSVPIQKSYSYYAGSLSYGYSLLVHHVEVQKPGHVIDILQSSTTRSSALYQQMVKDGNLEKTYPDFVRKVLAAAMPDKEPWVNGWIVEKDDRTWAFARTDVAIGSVAQKRTTRTGDAERAAEYGYGGIAAPLTTRSFTVDAQGVKEPRNLEIKLTEGGTSSDRAWIVKVPFTGKPDISRLQDGSVVIKKLGKNYGSVLVAVFNNSPVKEMRFKLSLRLEKEPVKPLFAKLWPGIDQARPGQKTKARVTLSGGKPPFTISGATSMTIKKWEGTFEYKVPEKPGPHSMEITVKDSSGQVRKAEAVIIVLEVEKKTKLTVVSGPPEGKLTMTSNPKMAPMAPKVKPRVTFDMVPTVSSAYELTNPEYIKLAKTPTPAGVKQKKGKARYGSKKGVRVSVSFKVGDVDIARSTEDPNPEIAGRLAGRQNVKLSWPDGKRVLLKFAKDGSLFMEKIYVVMVHDDIYYGKIVSSKDDKVLVRWFELNEPGGVLSWYWERETALLRGFFKNGKLRSVEKRRILGEEPLSMKYAWMKGWHGNGKPHYIALYDEEGMKHGITGSWDEDGHLVEEQVFKHESKFGVWRKWYPGGGLEKETWYEDGNHAAIIERTYRTNGMAKMEHYKNQRDNKYKLHRWDKKGKLEK